MPVLSLPIRGVENQSSFPWRSRLGLSTHGSNLVLSARPERIDTRLVHMEYRDHHFCLIVHLFE